MDTLLDTTVLFALVLAFALLIERLLEIAKCVLDLADAHYDWARFWTDRAHAVRHRLEGQLKVFEYVEPERAAAVVNRFQEMLLGPSTGYAGTVPTVSGDLVRALTLKVAFKAVGVALGVAIAWNLHLDIVALWQPPTETPRIARGWIEAFTMAPKVRWVMTGAVMGLSSTLVHKVITAIEDSREDRKEKGGQA